MTRPARPNALPRRCRSRGPRPPTHPTRTGRVRAGEPPADPGCWPCGFRRSPPCGRGPVAGRPCRTARPGAQGRRPGSPGARRGRGPRHPGTRACNPSRPEGRGSRQRCVARAPTARVPTSAATGEPVPADGGAVRAGAADPKRDDPRPPGACPGRRATADVPGPPDPVPRAPPGAPAHLPACALRSDPFSCRHFRSALAAPQHQSLPDERATDGKGLSCQVTER